jgi:sugar phosphate isomerase/epimerase
MHLARSGSTAEDLAAVDSSLFGYVQLSDATLKPRSPVYRDDSSDRSVPGEGELPLAEIMSALPEWLPVGVEAPMRSRAAQGMPVGECARLAVEGARAVLAQVRSRPR